MDPKTEADELNEALRRGKQTIYMACSLQPEEKPDPALQALMRDWSLIETAARHHLSALRAQPVTREAIAEAAERAFVDADPLDAWPAVADAFLRLLQASAPAANPDETAALALLRRLGQGGSIVTTAGMTETQVAIARAADRLLVTADGYGYVFVPGPVGLAPQASAPAVPPSEAAAPGRERDKLEGEVGRLRTENAGLRERVKSEMLRALDALEQGSQLFDEDSFYALRERIVKGEF